MSSESDDATTVFFTCLEALHTLKTGISANSLITDKRYHRQKVVNLLHNHMSDSSAINSNRQYESVFTSLRCADDTIYMNTANRKQKTAQHCNIQ